MAITRVQSITATTSATNAVSLAITFGATPTAGNIVVIAVTALGTTRFQMNRQAGMTWNVLSAPVANGLATIIWGRVGSAIASATVTVNISSGTQPICAVAAEYHGTNIRIDKDAGTADVNSTPAASGATDTTSSAAELWVGGIGARGTGANALTPTGAWSAVGTTNTTNGTSNADRTVSLLEQIVSSTGTPSATATLASSNSWSAVCSTFEETPMGASGSSYTYGG